MSNPVPFKQTFGAGNGATQRGPFPYFKPGVREVFLGKKQYNTLYRILPSFDFRRLGHPDFSTSFVSSRDYENKDTNGQPSLNPFYTVVKDYSFFGKAQANFISPLTRRALNPGASQEEWFDPIERIRVYAKDSPAGSEFKKISDTKVKDSYGREKYVLKKYENRVLLQVAKLDAGSNRVKDSRDVGFAKISSASFKAYIQERMAVPLVTQQGHKNFMEGLTGEDEVQDGQLYMCGDFTHPQRGLVCTFREMPLGQFAGGAFTFDEGTGYVQLGMRSAAIDNSVLAQRKAVFNPYAPMDYERQDVLHIPTAQEIVDFLVADGVYDYELICKALDGFNLNVPSKPKKDSTPSKPAQSDEEEEDVSMPHKPMPKAPAPVTPPQAPARVATSLTASLKSTGPIWVHTTEGVKKMSYSDFVTQLTLGTLTVKTKVMNEDKVGGWMEAGIRFPELAQAAAPEAPPEAPDAPPEAPEAPPEAPVAPAAPPAKLQTPTPSGGGIPEMGPDSVIDEYIGSGFSKYAGHAESQQKRQMRALTHVLHHNTRSHTDAESAVFSNLMTYFN